MIFTRFYTWYIKVLRCINHVLESFQSKYRFIHLMEGNDTLGYFGMLLRKENRSTLEDQHRSIIITYHRSTNIHVHRSMPNHTNEISN